MRPWRCHLESQEVAEQAPVLLNLIQTGTDTCTQAEVLKVGFSFLSLLAVWSFTRTKDIPAGHCRSLSLKSCLWNVDDGSGANQWVLVPFHHWSGETFSQVLGFQLKCPWICQGCTNKHPLSQAVWKYLVIVEKQFLVEV